MRFLFCSLASQGYVYPSIYVANGLRQRDHTVAFATGPDFSDVLSRHGFERIPLGQNDGQSFCVQHWGDPAEIVQQILHVEYATSQFGPDVVVSSPLALGPLILGKSKGLPVAVLGLGTFIWPVQQACTLDVSPYHGELQGRFESVLGLVTAISSLLGITLSTDHTYDNNPLLGDLFLLRSVPELEPYASCLPSRVHFVGSCLWEPTFEHDLELTNWISRAHQAGDPVIYVQHGRAGGHGLPDFWQPLVEALGGKPVLVIASVMRTRLDLSSLPQNFLVRDSVPYGQVLPYADAVIATGTSSIMLSSLVHGLPMLLIVIGSESFDVVERCRHARVAVSLSALQEGDLTPHRMVASVNELLNLPELRNNAKRLQQAFHRPGLSPHAVQLLELLGKRRTAIHRSDTTHNFGPAASGLR